MHILTVKVRRFTRDQSLTNLRETTLHYLAERLTPGEALADRGRLIFAFEDPEITLSYMTDHFMVEPGQTVETPEYQVPNRHITEERVSFLISLEEIDPAAYLSATLKKLQERYCTEVPATLDTLDVNCDKEVVLGLAEYLINAGEKSFWPLYAALQASDNWSTLKIGNLPLFRKLFLQGIVDGALAPDCAYAWEHVASIALNNDPNTFMEDAERFHDIVAEAAPQDKNAAEVLEVMAYCALMRTRMLRVAESRTEGLYHTVTYTRDYVLDELRPGKIIEKYPSGKTVGIADAGEDYVLVDFMGKILQITPGHPRETDFASILPDGTMPTAETVEEVSMRFSIVHCLLDDYIFEAAGELSRVYEDRGVGEDIEKELKDLLMSKVERCIGLGYADMFPLRALLAATDRWNIPEIVRPDEFRRLLLEGVEEGALAPECEIGWYWLGIAAEYNDPTHFMDDMERYYELLADAAAEDVGEAREIMDRIWEPENLQEED